MQTIIIPLGYLTHLSAALPLRSKLGGNTCVQRAAALMLDLKGATLVFGLMRAATAEERAILPQASPAPFIHAWVEHEGVLFTTTTVEHDRELRSHPIAAYYEAYGVKTTWRLDHKAFMQIARRYRLSSAFLHHSARAGDAEVADAILRAAGVKYVLSERRTLLPAP